MFIFQNDFIPNLDQIFGKLTIVAKINKDVVTYLLGQSLFSKQMKKIFKYKTKKIISTDRCQN